MAILLRTNVAFAAVWGERGDEGARGGRRPGTHVAADDDPRALAVLALPGEELVPCLFDVCHNDAKRSHLHRTRCTMNAVNAEREV